TAGNVLAINADGQRAWSTRLERAGRPVVVAGPPAVRGDAVWFLSRDGLLVGRSLADGSAVADARLDVPPVGGPVASGEDLAVPGDNTRLYIEPVLPRPLPPYDPSKAAKRRSKKEIPSGGNIALPGDKQPKIELPKDDDDDPGSKLTIHLLQGEVRDYTLKRSN